MSIDPKQTAFDLAEQGIIVIYGEVNGSMVTLVRDALAVARSNRVKELEVLIQSNGGSVRPGLDIFDMIRAMPVERRKGLVQGYARSMGAIILQSCEVREATRHSRLLIHYVATNEVSLQDLQTPRRLKKLIESGGRDQKYIDTILMKRTRRRLPEIQKACAKDADMTAEQAQTFGLIDSVRE